MIFRQLFDSVSGTYTYLLASRPGGEALIIDPVLDRVEHYMRLLRELDLKLVKAVDTHLHADHVTGLGALRDRTRCITVMGEASGVDVVSMRVREGDRIKVEGIALDVSGFVSEGSGQNLFLVRNNVLITPPQSSSILGGITRDSIVTIARGLGYDVREETVPREMLYLADEAFFCGTAVEVTPIRSIDKVQIGSGARPVTEAIRRTFFDILNGELPDTHGWLTFVYPEEAALREKPNAAAARG